MERQQPKDDGSKRRDVGDRCSRYIDRGEGAGHRHGGNTWVKRVGVVMAYWTSESFFRRYCHRSSPPTPGITKADVHLHEILMWQAQRPDEVFPQVEISKTYLNVHVATYLLQSDVRRKLECEEIDVRYHKPGRARSGHPTVPRVARSSAEGSRAPVLRRHRGK